MGCLERGRSRILFGGEALQLPKSRDGLSYVSTPRRLCLPTEAAVPPSQNSQRRLQRERCVNDSSYKIPVQVGDAPRASPLGESEKGLPEHRCLGEVSRDKWELAKRTGGRTPRTTIISGFQLW